MAANFQINQTTKKMNRKINQVFSVHSKDLRQKTDKITIDDYLRDYGQIFGGFEDRKLVRDDLYYVVKAEIDAKDQKKEQFKDKLQGKPLLPKTDATVAEAQRSRINDIEQDQAKRESQKEDDDQTKNK